MKAGATARDYGWLSLAVVIGLLTVLSAVACVIALVGGNVASLVRLPFSLLFGYWMAVGAWRRTRWGLVIVDATQTTPALDATHTRRLILVGAVCCIVLTLALALQVVRGRA